LESVSDLPPKLTPVPADELPVSETIVAPVVVAEISKIPDPLCVTPLEVAMAPVPDKESVPALIVVAPVYVLVPESVSVPVPNFVKAPNVPLITPEYVVEVLSLPTVNNAVPDVLPAPASEPIDCAKAPRAKVAPVPIVTAVLVERVLAIPAVNVPPLIVVAPV